VFFGKVDTIVNLHGGFFMEVGKTYLLYGRGYKSNYLIDGGCGYCTVHSTEIPENNDRVRDIEILTELSNIINNKQTCSYTMLAHNNKKLAEGFYKNGKPAGIWKHYLWNGNIKSEYNFEENSEIQYDDNGFKKFKPYKLEQSSMYGKVTDNKTGKGIGGVRIALFRDRNLYFTEFAETWDDGSYYIESIPIGIYEVRVEDFGSFGFDTVKRGKNYGTVKKEIEIKKDEELEFHLQLEAISSVAE